MIALSAAVAADDVVLPAGAVHVSQVHANMRKVEQFFDLAPARYRSMRALLEAETASGMHQPGGLLTDPSAAMGLLWARRGLAFWVLVYKDRLERPEASSDHLGAISRDLGRASG